MGHHVITIRFYCSPTSKITVDQQLCWASVVIRWLCEACSVKQHIPSFSNEAARQSSSLSLSLSLSRLWRTAFSVVCMCVSFFTLLIAGSILATEISRRREGKDTVTGCAAAGLGNLCEICPIQQAQHNRNRFITRKSRKLDFHIL